MKIYTKTGDQGQTSLVDGSRVKKSSKRIITYGELDCLNSTLGWVISSFDSSFSNEILNSLIRVQNELFNLGCELATPSGSKPLIELNSSSISLLEKEIDSWDLSLPKLNEFILPGGSETAARVHIARVQARKVERFLVQLNDEERTRPEILIYINRLSDWLFVLARVINKIKNINEIKWLK